MKTLLELAKEHNLFSIDNLPEYALNDGYFVERLDWHKERASKHHIPEGLKDIKGITFGVFNEVRAQKYNNSDEVELYYIDWTYTLILVDGSQTVLQLIVDRKDKYWLYPLYSVINKLTHNLPNHKRQEAIKKLKEPNRIGVFTFKKLNDWNTHCIEYLQALENCKNEVNNIEQENRNKINKTIEALKDVSKVTTHTNRFWIETPNFEIRFELLDGGTYLKQEIQYKGGIDNLIKIENSKF
jgi:hypothetical protein